MSAKALESAGADMVVLSGGRNVESTWFMFGRNIHRAEITKVLKQQGERLMALAIAGAASHGPKVEFKEMYFREHSLKIRGAVKLPLAFLGGVKSLANNEQALKDGFDAVVMTHALIMTLP